MAHIVTAFENELRDINRKVAEMGGLAEKSVVDSIDALIKRDTILAQRVIAADTRLDQLQRVIALLKATFTHLVIDLGKAYGSENSGSFINGILDALYVKLRGKQIESQGDEREDG